MNTLRPSRVSSRLVAAGLLFGASFQSSAMVALSPPSFSVPQISYYCSATYPTAGGALWESAQGDYNSNPCAGAAGAKVRRVGMMTNDGWNISETRCDPNYYWISELWGGHAALVDTSTAAEQTPTNGNCWSKVTVGPDLRSQENSLGVGNQFSDTTLSYPIPGGYSHGTKTFHPTQFTNAVRDRMNASSPPGMAGLVGFQVSVRAKLAANAPRPAPMAQGLLVNAAFGKVAGGQFSLPLGSQPGIGNPNMDVTRRFDSASMAKTLTAVAAVAAFEDIEEDGNPLKVNLESRIKPNLNAIGWIVDNSLANVTFRDLLRHTTPLCENGRPGGDRFADLKAMMAYHPATPDAPWQPSNGNPIKGKYCNHNFALMRVLLGILLEGRHVFLQPSGLAMRSDEEIDRLTAISYRNFVRGKLFAPIGLNNVDVFYKGALPETIYFRDDGSAIPDRVNVGSSSDTSGYDLRANTTMLSAGAGFWYLSAQEWTLFLSNLWAGRIVSQTSLKKLLTNTYALGMYGLADPASGGLVWNNSGGGWAGGPWTQWVTFPDGASAVIQSNAPTGDASFYAILVDAYNAAWY